MRYETATVPILALKWENQRVVLDCESEPETPAKLLYPRQPELYNTEEARAVFNQVKAQYEARRKAEA